MKEIKQAIITLDKEIRCPICGKLNGILTGDEVVKNFKMRCKGSNGRTEHFFILNVGRGAK